LRQLGALENYFKMSLQTQTFHPGFWVTSQGVDANLPVINSVNKVNTYDFLRLFRVTGSLVLPSRVTVRLMSCSEDITHSWAVPGLGIKVDCVPGRLFCIFTNILRNGIYFGQCSELCGWNHYNMPIAVYGLSIEHFIIWWELELHAIFSDTFEQKGDLNVIGYLTRYYNSFNYFLLNWKYK
jgi:heme/copper-type cytochrome/quinol oxidase subunit 2